MQGFSQLQFMRQGIHQVKTKRDLTETSEQPSKKRPAFTLSGSDLGFLKPTIAKRDFRKIREYIDTHGFGPTTPALTRHLSADIFRQHYYDKSVLMEFCREIGISTIGLKNEINDRIDLYLRTKKITRIEVPKKTGTPDSEEGLRLDKIVVNYKSDPKTRAFLQKHIGDFTGFSAYVQKWLKARLANGEIFTYGDIVAEHKRFLQGKQSERVSGKRPVVAHDSCQFNQFYIDYSHDTEEMPHTAKEAWFLVRDTAGAKTYERYKEKIQQIMTQINAIEL